MNTVAGSHEAKEQRISQLETELAEAIKKRDETSKLLGRVTLIANGRAEELAAAKALLTVYVSWRKTPKGVGWVFRDMSHCCANEVEAVEAAIQEKLKTV